jgi:ribosomal protein S18 acetylase RimI-like enzyme
MIRIAEPPDAAAVHRISAEAYTAAYQPVIGYVPKPAFEDYSRRIMKGEVLVICPCGDVAGLMVLKTRPDHLLVYSIAVATRAQGKGYGRTLLAYADVFAARTHNQEIRLFTNARMTTTLDFYHRCGFREVGTRPHPTRTGEHLVDLVKIAGRTRAISLTVRQISLTFMLKDDRW